MEEKELTRREREALRHRAQMLETALDLFSEKGFHNVSMHEIAGKAEFAIGTLYKFFKNKEDLYKALIMEQAEKFHNALTFAIDYGEDELSKINNFVRIKGEMYMNNVKVIRLYFAETRGASFNLKAGLDTDIQKMYREFLQKLAAVFESGVKKNLFRRLDSYSLAVSLDSLTSAFLFRWLEDPDGQPYEKNVEIIKEIFFKGIMINTSID